MINEIYELFKSDLLSGVQYEPAGVILDKPSPTYITYLVTTNTPNNHLDSNFDSSKVRVQFDVYSVKQSEVESTAEKLISAIINEGEGMINFVLDDPFDTKTRRYRKIVDVSFFNN